MQQINQHYIDINFCPNKNGLELFCCNYDCNNSALVCRNQKCTCNSQNHKHCSLISAPQILDKIISKRKQMNKQLAQSCQYLRTIYNDAIDRLSKDRQTLDIWQKSYGMTQAQYKLLDLLTNKSQTITGKFIHYVRSKLKIKKQGVIKMQQIKQNWEPKKQVFDRLFNKLGNPFMKFNFTLQQHLKQCPIPQSHHIKQNQLLKMASQLKWDPLLQKARTKKGFKKITELQLIGSRQYSKKNINTDIFQIKHFQSLKNLKKLSLMGNQIQKIQGLNQLKLLEWLHLGWNRITKIQNLECLQSLSTLYLNHNKIEKIENLKQVKKLKILWIGGNPATLNKQQVQQQEGTMKDLKDRNILIYFM